MAGRGVDIILGGAPRNEEEQKAVRELGGLCVIGTERHEARRIDNQLRGRAGRQGDPGVSQFYVSLEDSLMRIFASDTIKRMMGRFGIPENQPIENSLITRSLENAQTKIEGFNFDARKHILEYDNVLNHQRSLIYAMRRKVLSGDREEVYKFLNDLKSSYPDIADIIEKKISEIGEDDFYRVAGRIILQAVDMYWMDHLEAMDYLRSSVNLRAYGQRDPLVEYKKEGLRLFKEMQDLLDQFVLQALPTIQRQARPAETLQLKQVRTNEDSMASKESVSVPVRKEGEVGRNDPCPCGSGKKYKKCHGA